jgi:hypothetical protein
MGCWEDSGFRLRLREHVQTFKSKDTTGVLQDFGFDSFFNFKFDMSAFLGGA